MASAGWSSLSVTADIQTWTFIKYMTGFFMNQSPLPTPWWPPLLYILWWECGHPELTFWFCSQLVPPAVHYARSSPWPIAFSYWGGGQCFQDDCSLAVFHSIHLTQGKVNPPCLSNCRISACFYCDFSLSHQCKGAPELSVWEPGCSFLDTETLQNDRPNYPKTSQHSPPW